RRDYGFSMQGNGELLENQTPIGIQYTATVTIRENKNGVAKRPFRTRVAPPGKPACNGTESKGICQQRDRLIEAKAAGDVDCSVSIRKVTAIGVDVRFENRLIGIANSRYAYP